MLNSCQVNVQLRRYSQTELILFVYICILWKVGINQPNVEVAIAKIVVGLVCSWMIAWTPYSLITLLGISGQAKFITPFNSMLPALFAKTAACVDPFIYALNHPKIRQEILFRLYNSFLLSTGRRGESLNSDSARIPDWKISGSARVTRQGLLCQTGTQHGRIGSLASFRRFNKTRHPQSGVGSSGREDMRRSISLSSAASRTVNAEGLETADIIASMIHRNQELHGQFRSILSTTEMSCLPENNLTLTSLNQCNSPTIPNLKTPSLTSSSV